MPLPTWIVGLFQPIADLIDELHTSADEKATAKVALLSAQADVVSNVLDYEARLAEAQTKVIVAEAQGTSWLQRNWRPLIMLTFGFVVLWNFVVAPLATWVSGHPVPQLEMTAGFWTLLSVGIGGYVAGRSGEKIAATISQNK
jgi:hypothetical protein